MFQSSNSPLGAEAIAEDVTVEAVVDECLSNEVEVLKATCCFPSCTLRLGAWFLRREGEVVVYVQHVDSDDCNL